MSEAIITGISKPLLDRLKPLLKSRVCSFRPGWDVNIVPPPNSKHQFPFEINLKELEKLLPQKPNGGGPHFLAYNSPREEQRAWLRRNIDPFFRLRWLDNSTVQGQQREHLVFAINSINEVLAAEEEWCDFVKPHDVISPLLLPEKQFEARGEHRNLWNHARAGDLPRIHAFPKKIEAFRQSHLRKRDDQKKVWIDEVDHIFDWHGQLHAVAHPPSCWKFSYLIPTGFHFDVTSTRSSSCIMTGVDEIIYKAPYLNIDPHGHIRPGS
jgi:hypothetical protein